MDSLERASKIQHVRPDTLCSFIPGDPHTEEDVPSLSTPGLRSAGPMVSIEDELSAEVVESTSTHDTIKFWPWVQEVNVSLLIQDGAILTQCGSNQTPLTVSPQLPLEIAMQLFKRMG